MADTKEISHALLLFLISQYVCGNLFIQNRDSKQLKKSHHWQFDKKRKKKKEGKKKSNIPFSPARPAICAVLFLNSPSENVTHSQLASCLNLSALNNQKLT